MRRFGVAAAIDTWMRVKFKVIDGSGDSTSEVEKTYKSIWSVAEISSDLPDSIFEY